LPYYLFAVKGFGQLELLGEFAVFREASARAKLLRAQPGSPTIKVMFGENQLAAEDALLQVRDPAPPGEE
jgi:hypothetical protein